jgi:hypothetical protein
MFLVPRRSPFGAALFAALATGSLHAEAPQRYCNPLPIPNFPVGKLVRDVTKGEPNDGGLWFSEKKEQFRELADPTALWHEGAWYLYPSCDMAWVSREEGRTWQHQPLNVPAATSTPQPVSASADAIPWVPLNDGEPTFGSASAPNTAGRNAADASMTTWWLPAEDDEQPVLTTSFAASEIRAVRVIWRGRTRHAGGREPGAVPLPRGGGDLVRHVDDPRRSQPEHGGLPHRLPRVRPDHRGSRAAGGVLPSGRHPARRGGVHGVRARSMRIRQLPNREIFP